MSTSDKVGIVLIDYYSAERTIQYINESKAFFSGYDVDYVIVDNSCDNNNYQKLCHSLGCKSIPIDNPKFEKAYSNDNCYILKSKKNNGFACSNNLGYKYLKNNCNYKYVVFSNSDVQFVSGVFFKDITKCFDLDPKIAVVGPRIEGLDNKPQSPCRKMSIFERWWKTQILWPFDRLFRMKGSNDLVIMHRSDYVYRIIGAFMIVRPLLFEKAGMFDERTFLYAEEPILSERLIRKGFKTYYCNDCLVIHEGGYTTSDKKGLINIKKIKRVFESEMYYYKRYVMVSDPVLLFSKIIFAFYCLKLRFVNLLKSIFQILSK